MPGWSFKWSMVKLVIFFMVFTRFLKYGMQLIRILTETICRVFILAEFGRLRKTVLWNSKECTWRL